MTVRGFLLWYLGAVTFVGVAGASGYQIMARQHAESAARGVAVAGAQVSPPAAMGADAQPQAAAPSVNPAPLPTPLPAPVPTNMGIAALPLLRPPVTAASPPAPVTHQPAHRAVALHHPIHRPVAVAAAPRVRPRYQPPPYTALYPPPPPRPVYYGYPSYYVYRGGYAYYSYYPRYGYYPVY